MGCLFSSKKQPNSLQTDSLMNNKGAYDVLSRIIFIGCESVGKSCLVAKYSNSNTELDKIKPTVEIKITHTIIHYQYKKIKLEIFDMIK